jgi:hypothetical protein
MNNFTPHILTNFDEFIQKVDEKSTLQKRLVTHFTDPSIKKINDEFTNIVNKMYITSENNLLDQYMYEVMSIFGDYDSYDLQPNNYHTIRRNLVNPSIIEKERNINDPNLNSSGDYIHDQNLFNPNVPAGAAAAAAAAAQIFPKGYFVFKGGNIIKYHTMVKFLFIYYHQRDYTIQQLLSKDFLRKHDVNNILNTYSDFDFSYYVQQFEDNDTSKNQIYTNDAHRCLSKHTAYRTFILRNRIESSFNNYVDALDIQRLMLNSSLHAKIQAYFDIEDSNIGVIYTKVERIPGKNYSDTNFHQQISLVNNVTNSIVHKVLDQQDDPNNDRTDVYMLNENKRTKVTINYTIKSNRADFDLYRIKIMFDVNNNYNRCKFASELFDLTIIRPIVQNDTQLYKNTINNFYKNIDNYTELIQTSYNGQQFFVRAYSLLYTLKDLIVVLFDDKSLFPWTDNKYNKRIIRLGFLYAGYIDDLKDTYPEELSYKMLQFYLMLYLMILQYKFSNIVNDLEVEDVIKRRDIYREIVFNSLVATLSLMRRNNHNDLMISCLQSGVQTQASISTILTSKITNMLNNTLLTMRQDVVLKMYEEKEDYIHIKNYKIVEYIMNIILLLICKIYVEINLVWCVSKNNNAPININSYKIEFCNFFKTLVQNFLIGLDCQSNILSNFNFANHNYIRNGVVMNGGGNELDDINNSLKMLNIKLSDKKSKYTDMEYYKHYIDTDITNGSLVKQNQLLIDEVFADFVMHENKKNECINYINEFHEYVKFIKIFKNGISSNNSTKEFNYDHSSMNISYHYYDAVKKIHSFHTKLTEYSQLIESSQFTDLSQLKINFEDPESDGDTRLSVPSVPSVPSRQNSYRTGSNPSSYPSSITSSRSASVETDRERSGDKPHLPRTGSIRSLQPSHTYKS